MTGDLVIGAGNSASLTNLDPDTNAPIPGPVPTSRVLGNVFNSGALTLQRHRLDVSTGRVENSGRLIVDGTLDARTVINNAILGPGTSAGIATLGGDYEQTSEGNLEIELGGTTAGTEHDQLIVGGTASFEAGTTVTVVLIDPADDAGANVFSPANGDTFDIVLADAITVPDPDDLSALLDFSGLPMDVSFDAALFTIDGQDIFRLQALVAALLTATPGLSAAETAVGASLEAAAAAGGSADVVALADELAALESDAARAEALAEAGPNAVTALYDAGRLGAARAAGHLGRHLDAAIWNPSAARPTASAAASTPTPAFQPTLVREQRDLLALARGLTSGSASGEATLFSEGAIEAFITATGEFGDVAASANQSGYDFSGGALTTGVEVRINDAISLGLAGTYGALDADIDGGRGATDSDFYGVSGYAQARIARDYFLDATISHTWSDHDTTRRFTAGGAAVVARGNTDGTAWSAVVRGAARFPVGAGFVGPVARLEYADVSIDGYTETGAGGLSLTVGNESAQWFAGSLGVRGAVPIETRLGRVTPSGGIALVHAFENEAPSLTASFTGAPGTPFTVPTDDTDDTYLELDLGLSLDFGADARLSLGYRGTLANDDVERHALTASLRLRF